jgi:acyl carrier protein
MERILTWERYRERVAGFLGIEPDRLDRDTHLFETLGVYSLGMHLIEAFGVRIPLSEVSCISTVGDLYEAMNRHRENPA